MNSDDPTAMYEFSGAIAAAENWDTLKINI